MTATDKKLAKITSTSVRIIIDIPDATGFDWERAHKLWAENFKNGTIGTAGRNSASGSLLGYTWYKVNPKTNALITKPMGGTVSQNMMPMPGYTPVIQDTTDLDNALKEFYLKLERIETIVYRLKTTNDPNVKITDADRIELMNDVKALRAEVAVYEGDAK